MRAWGGGPVHLVFFVEATQAHAPRLFFFFTLDFFQFHRPRFILKKIIEFFQFYLENIWFILDDLPNFYFFICFVWVHHGLK